MRIGILGTADNPYVLDVQRAAAEHFPGMSTVLLRWADLQVAIGAPGVELATGLVPELSAALPLDGLLVRSMPIGSLEQVIFRMDCLQTWLERGLAICNPPRSLEVAIDKWLCLQRLQAAGVSVPPTICCQTRQSAMLAWEMLGGDVLVKPLFGGEGRGIVRLQDKDMAWRCFGTLQQLGQVLYVQQFIEHLGYDIRVLAVGQQRYAVRRVAPAGGWRTNISQGSHAEPHDLTCQQADVAQRCCEVVGGSLLGIDLLPSRDGQLWVLEVNAVPGWRGVGSALHVDVAREILKVISQHV